MERSVIEAISINKFVQHDNLFYKPYTYISKIPHLFRHPLQFFFSLFNGDSLLIILEHQIKTKLILFLCFMTTNNYIFPTYFNNDH